MSKSILTRLIILIHFWLALLLKLHTNVIFKMVSKLHSLLWPDSQLSVALQWNGHNWPFAINRITVWRSSRSTNDQGGATVYRYTTLHSGPH